MYMYFGKKRLLVSNFIVKLSKKNLFWVGKTF